MVFAHVVALVVLAQPRQVGCAPLHLAARRIRPVRAQQGPRVLRVLVRVAAAGGALGLALL